MSLDPRTRRCCATRRRLQSGNCCNSVFPARRLDLDVNLSLDLNLDSFGWMELALLLQDRLGVHLSETDIAAIETVRDLLRRSIERGACRLPRRSARDCDRYRALARPDGACC